MLYCCVNDLKQCQSFVSKYLDPLMNSIKNQNQVAQKLLKFQMGIDLNQNIDLSDSMKSVIDAGNQTYVNVGTFNIENNIDYKLMLTQENLSLLSLYPVLT